MKILLAGDWRYDIYERACANALSHLGADVKGFAWNRYFRSLLGQVQAKWLFPGPLIFQLNYDLLRFAKEVMPDVIFIWRGTHILPQTLRKLKKVTGSILISYNNDDPFGPNVHGFVPLHHHVYWKLYRACILDYDIHFVYRPVNLAEIKSSGAKEAYILMPYYIPEINHPIELNEEDKDKYDCDVVFVGHYEPDGREKYLKALVDGGLHVRLFGGQYWTPRVLGKYADYFGSVHLVTGLEYTKALCGAKMCLCFLSRLNRDTYTRRCFEIPACGKLLLSERTNDLQQMFKDDEEAVFFSHPEELVQKTLWLCSRPEKIEAIARAGRLRVLADGHSVYERMKRLLLILRR